MIESTMKQLFPLQHVSEWLRHISIFYCDLLPERLQCKIHDLLRSVNQKIFEHIVYRCVIGLRINHSTVGWEPRRFVQ